MDPAIAQKIRMIRKNLEIIEEAMRTDRGVPDDLPFAQSAAYVLERQARQLRVLLETDRRPLPVG